MYRILSVAAVAALLAGCANTPALTPPSPEDRQAQAFSTYLSARFAASEHDLPQAASYYSQSLKNDPANGSLLALSFFYSSTAGDMEQAAQYATQVVAANPDDRAARMALAVVDFKHRNYADARKQMAQSAKGPFTLLTLSLFDAWASAALHDTASVDKDVQTLMSQKGAETLAAFHGALLEDFLGNTKLAEAAYKKAMESQAVTPRILEAYGRFLERNGRAQDAEALYKAHEAQGGLASVTAPGLKRIAAGQKAEPMIRTPQDGAAEALFGIAASLSGEQSADVSILYLRMALYLRPDLALANILLADRLETLQKFDAAIGIYRTIPQDSPYYRMAAIQAALDEQRVDRKDEAVAGLKALLAISPDDSEAWTALGDTYRNAEKFGDAVDAYDHAITTSGSPEKKDWMLFYARAMAKEKLGKLDESEADMQQGLKLSPDQPELLNYLGYSWVDRGMKIPEALGMLEKARTLRPYDGYVVDSVGWAYYKLGRYDDAARTLEAAVLLVPGDATINDHLGDALWRAGHKIDARFQWNHAIAFSDSDSDKAAIERKLKTGLSEKPA